jgi:multimeric flavodoxin WrbA
MQITIVYGQTHKGNTYKLTKMLLDRISAKELIVKEFYVNDLRDCIGCTSCITKGENHCPHNNEIKPIIDSVMDSEIFILSSPNYCMGMTGQMKTFFDHLAYMWLSHRPRKEMQRKIGITISTAAGVGASKVTKAIKQQLFWLYTGKVYQLSFVVKASKWEDVDAHRMKKLEKKIDKLAHRINDKDVIKPNLKQRLMFMMMAKMQEKSSWNPLEKEHWRRNGWIK